MISICVLFLCTWNLRHSSLCPSSRGERGGDRIGGVEQEDAVVPLSSKLERLDSKFLSSVDWVEVVREKVLESEDVWWL